VILDRVGSTHSPRAIATSCEASHCSAFPLARDVPGVLAMVCVAVACPPLPVRASLDVAGHRVLCVQPCTHRCRVVPDVPAHPVSTSCTRRPPAGCGSRTQHTISALPMSNAATRSMICPPSPDFTNTEPTPAVTVPDGHASNNRHVTARGLAGQTSETNPRALSPARRQRRAPHATPARLTDGLTGP
jgi:hypothetical protein